MLRHQRLCKMVLTQLEIEPISYFGYSSMPLIMYMPSVEHVRVVDSRIEVEIVKGKEIVMAEYTRGLLSM